MTHSNVSAPDVDEPKLTYERILNDLSVITSVDSITSSCLHSKFFAIGTAKGRIYVLDHQGNKVNRQELRFHLKSVVCISIDERGEYLASSSADRLVVYGLCDGKPYFNIMPDKPINVVAIDPYFHKADAGRRFVTGDDRLVFYERGLLTRYKSSVVQFKERRPIKSLSWHGQFIAWATDSAAHIYDVDQRAIITRIKREGLASSPYWDDTCHFCWKEKRIILIGWCNSVKICVIKDRSREMANDNQLRELPKKYVEIISMFETDFLISGLSPFNDNLLTLSTNYPSNLPDPQKSSPDNQSVSGLSLSSQPSTYGSTTQSIYYHDQPLLLTSQGLPSNFDSFGSINMAIDRSGCSSSASSQVNNNCDQIETVSVKTDDIENCFIKPQVHLLDTNQNSYNEISKDVLTPNDCSTIQQLYLSQQQQENNIESSSKASVKRNHGSIPKISQNQHKPAPFALLSLHQEGIYFIVCPKDIISARPRDYDDHIDWLIQHEMLKDAHIFARENRGELMRYSVRELEEMYMNQLIESGTSENFSEAAGLCVTICDQDQEAWDKAIKRFCDLGQLKHLIPYLPKQINGFHLSNDSYNFVLNEFLKSDSVSFFRAIKEIPFQLYSLQEMLDNVIRNLANDPKDLVLNEALAELYTCEGNFEEAVNIYLDYNDKGRIFPLIRNNNLVSILRDRVDRLMQIDAIETSKLLVENVDYIPIREIVERLESYKSKRFLVSYLHRLVMRNPDSCIEYHDLLVRLYAQYQPDSLLNFLKTSTNYSLEEALIICKEANLIKEVVYLLGRMGDLRIALKYIVESQGVHEAIEFCKEHQDSDMWQDLIVYSMDNVEYVSALLKNIGTHINDPIDLIDRIPNGCEIEGLMPALVKILQDYQLQISLEKCCRDLMAKDCFSLLEKQIRGQTQAIAVREDQLCDHCNQPLMGESISDTVSQSRSVGSSSDGAGQVTNIASSSLSSVQTRQTNIIMGGPSVGLNDLVIFGCHHVFHEECCASLSSNESSTKRKYPDNGLKIVDSLGAGQEIVDCSDGTTKILSCRVCMIEKDDDSLAQS